MKTIKNIILSLAVVLGFTACVNDLNVTPIDPNVVQDFDENALFCKLYNAFAQTGNKGGGGDADITTDDEGYCGFFRTLCVLNEFPTDAYWWIWNNDGGVMATLTLSWDAANPFVSKLYNRLNYGITMANLYLDNTKDATDKEHLARRAEARFIRAYNYYYMLDFFGKAPFTTTVDMQTPDQIVGKDLYDWLIKEINEFMPEMYETTGGLVGIYRATQPAAQMLLARLYLNAEIYTGTADWANAAKYAGMVKDNHHFDLAPNFSHIFMGDNDHNDAKCEMIFLAQQDGQHNRSDAGSQYAIAACRTEGMNDHGVSAAWGCNRCRPELVMKFFPGKTRSEVIALGNGHDEFTMPAVAGDDRAMFCQKADAGFEAEFCGCYHGNGQLLKSNWALCKWTNLYSDGTSPTWTSYTDTDVPLIRMSEAYLTYAEALYRQDPTSQEALEALNAVRRRAHASEFTALTDEIICDEWLREFYLEGRRRIDLIRWHEFAGPQAWPYNWEGRGGAQVCSFVGEVCDPANENNSSDKDATDQLVAPIAVDAHFNLYPIPSSECAANPNMKQNPGY
ncbi:MAG: RagB/SusD family nutrient uptake outer membrane protein [Paludibacteraceae bacterium]|nr:RagB/SusD family nutrient uptake outer membrane protein [Paludibacteraceae bacterium]